MLTTCKTTPWWLTQPSQHCPKHTLPDLPASQQTLSQAQRKSRPLPRKPSILIPPSPLTTSDLSHSVARQEIYHAHLAQIPPVLHRLAAFMQIPEVPYSPPTTKFFRQSTSKINRILADFEAYATLTSKPQPTDGDHGGDTSVLSALRSSNEEYEFLISDLLPKLRGLHLVLQKQPATVPPTMRNELGRIKFDEAFREWAAVFERAWVMLGGIIDEIKI